MERKINLIGISGKKQHGKNTVGDIILQLTNYSWQQKSYAEKLKSIASILLGIPKEDFEKEEVKNRLLPAQWTLKTDKTERQLTVRGFLQLLGTEAVRDVIHPNAWENALFTDYKVTYKGSYFKDFIFESCLTKTQYKYWVNNPERRGIDICLYAKEVYPNWIITDVRYPNEAKAIESRGGILLRVFRPGQLRVWYNDKVNADEEDDSGYYYVQKWNGDYMEISEKRDGLGASIAGNIFKNLEFDPSDKHPSETSLDDYKFDEIIINNGNKDDLRKQVKEILKKYNII